MRCFHALMAIAALLVSRAADGGVVDNRQNSGHPLIIPAVKKTSPNQELFKLPKCLRVTAPESVGLTLLEKSLQAAGVAMTRAAGGDCRLRLSQAGVPDHVEGYTMKIDSSGIEIAGRSEAGLFNGMQTLRFMLRNQSGNFLPGGEISDYPDLTMRAVMLECNDLTPEQVEVFCGAIEIYALLKYNTLVIDFGDNFPLPDNPYTLRKSTLSLADMTKIQETAKLNNMEIIPFVQAVSHTLWMTRHPEFKSAISEGEPVKPWASSYCLSKPLPLKLMMDYIDAVCAILKPRYFHLAMDELNFCPFQRCPDCAKADAVELFGNHAKKVTDYVLQKGVIPLVFHDTFEPDYAWGSGKVAAALDKLDRRTIINVWDYSPNPNALTHKYFKQKDFSILYMSWSVRLRNVWMLPRLAARDGSMGCVLTWWKSLPPTLRYRQQSRLESVASVTLAAEGAWNAMSENTPDKCPYDPVFELNRLLDPEKIPDFSRLKSTSLPLAGQFNIQLGADRQFPLLNGEQLRQLRTELSSLPERFDLDGDAHCYYGVALAGGKLDSLPSEPVMIPLGGTLKGLSLLLAAAPWNEFSLANNAKPELGALDICFANGKSVRLPLRYRDTINSWQAECGGFNLRVVNRGVDGGGRNYAFYALDWLNPLPEEQVKEIKFSTLQHSDIALVLFAATAFDANLKSMQTQTASRPVPRPHLAGNDNIISVADFAPGKHREVNYNYSTTDKFTTTLKFKPMSTAVGWLMAIRVPALKKGQPWGRVVMDIPLPTKDFNSIVFSAGFSNPQWIWRPDTYLLNPGKSSADSLLHYECFQLAPNTVYRYAITRKSYRGKEGGGLNNDSPPSLRIGYFVSNPEPMTIFLGPVGLSQELLLNAREIVFTITQ